MQKFFRKLRQKLLNEGQLQKYLLYAIGEIFLVVIGILIAIQINDWNEDRKGRIQEAILLEKLSQNIESNLMVIRETMQQDSASLQAIENLFFILENDLPYHDSIAGQFGYALAAFPTSLSSSTMETIRAKGVDLIRSDQIREQALDLFDIEYQQVAEIYQTDQQSYNNVEQGYILKNFQWTNFGTIPNDYSSILDDQEMLNILSMRRVFREYSILIKKGVMEKSGRLIKEIDAYLVQ